MTTPAEADGTPDLIVCHAPLPYARLIALAGRDPRRAVPVAERWAAATSAGDASSAWASYALGWALLRWERVPAARAHIAAALAAFTSAGNLSMALQCQCGLLIARQLLGEGIALQDDWQQLIEACARAAEWRVAARARCEQIAHLNVLGRPRDARDLAQACAPLIAQHGDPADQARFDHVAGVAAASCGDLDAAHAQLERARSQFSALHRPVDSARVLFERAWIWQRRERYDLARADLEQARAIFRRFDLPLRVAFCEKDLGTVAAAIGDYPAAIAQALRARDQFAEVGRRDLVARCDLNLGTVAHYSGLFELAIAAYGRAQLTYAELGDQRLLLICQRNQAMALGLQGQLADALALLDAIEQPVLAMGDQLEHAELLLQRALALGRLGQHARALECLAAAREHFFALGNPVAAARCLLEQGWMLLDQGQSQAAAVCLRDALPLLADRPVHHWRVQHGLGRVAEQQGAHAQALAYYDSASLVVAGLRRQLASEHASSGIFAQARQLVLDALRLARHQQDIERLLMLTERQRALVLPQQIASALASPPPALQAQRDQMRDQLRALLAAHAPPEQIDAALQGYVDALLHTRHHALPADTLPSTPFDLALLRQNLMAAHARDWTVLVPIILDDNLLLITLTADELTLATTPYDALLRGLIERASLPRYRMSTYRDLVSMRDPSAQAWATPRALAERLLPEPLRARLHPQHRLFIVPGGALHALPWAALRVGAAWLCELAIIELLPALVHAQATAVTPPAQARALLIGCETFGGRAPDLPGALASLDLVQARWPGPVTRLESAQASRDALLELGESGQLGQYGLIHIASHAQIGAMRGLLGHIKLADDDLLIDEVLRLNMRGALVLLAACDGAASEVLPGDEVLSINRALLAAGASSVVASLWPIYDLAALRLLDRFYQQLAAGADAALALALAQRALLAYADADEPQLIMLRSPFAWASFCVTSVGATEHPQAGGTKPAMGDRCD